MPQIVSPTVMVALTIVKAGSPQDAMRGTARAVRKPPPRTGRVISCR
jgi:hypothetical protein